ncbi:hypothetical protein GN956_G8704 [Arapaima gigas]
MTLGSAAAPRRSTADGLCSCCGARMTPYFSENAVLSQSQISQIINESFLTVKGAALFLPRGNGSTTSPGPRVTQRWNKHAGDLQQHLQTMFTLLRPEDNIRLAVRLESAHSQCTRYMVVVSTNGRQDTEESVVLGMDFSSSDGSCSVGLVLPLWSDTLIHLDGDGGFSVSTVNRVHVFKPVSVQAMWSALQSLHKACEVARCHNYYPGSLFLTWISYYQSQVTSNQACINEWNAMQDVQSHRADSPVLFTDVPTERERTERLIKTRLREIMMQKDLENVTSKEIRTELEMQMVCNLREFKEFIDNEMIVILGQMDSPTEIFDHVYLGSEWNASNLEELQNSGVRYILNVTREIDNFFPGLFEYYNIRVYDEEATNLLEYWNDTYKFISKAKKAGAKCLVHCKMGVSRSASTVIAYAMKEYGWDLERAFDHVKERRAVAKPNPSFMRQLEEYEGILLASKQRHNKLWRSHSDSDLSEQQGPLCKNPQMLGRSDPHNNNNGPPSLQHFLGMAMLQALAADTTEAVTHARGNEMPTTEATSEGCLNLKESSDLDKSKETFYSPASSLGQYSHLPPMPRFPTATVVPEAKTENSPVTVHLHSPQSLHSLTASSPEPKLETFELHMTNAGCLQPSTYVPEETFEPKCLPLATPDPKSPGPESEASEPRAAEHCNLSVLVHDYNQSDSLISLGTPLVVCPITPSLGSGNSDNNNNPSSAELQCVLLPTTEADSSNLNTDSINFCTARDKFLGLSQNGGALPLSPQTLHAKDPNQDLQPLFLDEPNKVGYTVSTLILLAVNILVQEEQLRVKEPETGEGVVYNPLPSHSLSLGPTDSVCHIAKQLEQRLRQEQECPLSSTLCHQSPSPSSHSHLECSEVFITVQQEEEKGDGQQAEEEHENESGTFTGEIVKLPDQSLILASNCNNLEPESLQALVHLKRVTELEMDIEQDLDCADGAQQWGRRAHSSQDLEKIQETLRELHAFLCEAGRLAGKTVGLAGNRVCPWSSEEVVVSNKNALQCSALELGARIRQAGLTPPSLMKRSASLAKLDRLELSTNDLSNWDLSATLVPGLESPPLASVTNPYPIQDDASKKQRVLPLQPCDPSVEVCKLGECSRGVGSCLCDHEPKANLSLVPSLVSSDVSCTDVDRAQDAQIATLPAFLATRQQQGKTQHLHRFRKPGDKKRTAAFLYNTM